jgi:hypothetical protein
MSGTPERIIAGRQIACVSNIRDELAAHTEMGFEFLVVPLVHPRQSRTFTHPPKRTDPLTRYVLHFVFWFLVSHSHTMRQVRSALLYK